MIREKAVVAFWPPSPRPWGMRTMLPRWVVLFFLQLSTRNQMEVVFEKKHQRAAKSYLRSQKTIESMWSSGHGGFPKLRVSRAWGLALYAFQGWADVEVVTLVLRVVFGTLSTQTHLSQNVLVISANDSFTLRLHDILSKISTPTSWAQKTSCKKGYNST